MKRSASEVIRNLENRVARLEKQATSNKISGRVTNEQLNIKIRADHVLKVFNNGEVNRAIWMMKKIIKDLQNGLGSSNQIQVTEDTLNILEKNAKKLVAYNELERKSRLMINEFVTAYNAYREGIDLSLHLYQLNPKYLLQAQNLAQLQQKHFHLYFSFDP